MSEISRIYDDEEKVYTVIIFRSNDYFLIMKIVGVVLTFRQEFAHGKVKYEIMVS